MAKMMATLYVPKGTKPEYHAMDGWSDFLNIDEGIAYYQLTLTAGHGGTIIYGESRVKEGASYTFYVEEGGSANLTIEADEHRELASLTMNSKDVTGSMEGNVFTITGMDQDVEIVATFRRDANTETIVLQSDMQAFCCNKDLDFRNVSGLKAYIAGGFDSSTNEVMLTSVEEGPAGTGVILQGTAGSSYDILVEKTSFVYFNLLKGTLSQTTISDGYVLRDDRFERVSTPTTVAANSAYLVLPTSVQGAQTLALRLKNGVIDDIDAVVTDLAGGNRHWYTLQGARLNDVPTTPGIYIRNGRKVMVK